MFSYPHSFIHEMRYCIQQSSIIGPGSRRHDAPKKLMDNVRICDAIMIGVVNSDDKSALMVCDSGGDGEKVKAEVEVKAKAKAKARAKAKTQTRSMHFTHHCRLLTLESDTPTLTLTI